MTNVTDGNRGAERKESTVVRLWRALPEWRAAAEQARAVVERLERYVEGTRLVSLLDRHIAARQAGRTGSGGYGDCLRTWLRVAAMAVIANRVANVAGDAAGIRGQSPRWLVYGLRRALLGHLDWRRLPHWRSATGLEAMLVAARRLIPGGCQIEGQCAHLKWVTSGRLGKLLAEYGDRGADSGSGGEHLARVASLLEKERRVQAWRCGDEMNPQLLLRTPAMFNARTVRKGGVTEPAWLRVFLLTGRLEAAGSPLPPEVSAWQPHGGTPRRVKGREVATEDLLLWMTSFERSAGGDPGLTVAEQCARVEAARREAARQQRRALRAVREALRNHPARVAETVLGESARVSDLVYLSAGHQGGERRRILFEDFRALGWHALRSSSNEAQRIGRAVDAGRPVADIVTEIQPREGGPLAAERLWRLGRRSRRDAEDRALDDLLPGRLDGGLPWATEALQQSASRRFEGWLRQDPIKLMTLKHVLEESAFPGMKESWGKGLAGMAWRSASRCVPEPLRDVGDVVGMLADDLIAPRIREEDRIANAIVLYDRLAQPTAQDEIRDANTVARLIAWGITLDSQAGRTTRWSEMARTCQQLHLPHVLAARDGILGDAAPPRTSIAPVGWPALTPARRIGVRHLADANQLREEGRRMQHCVGDYAQWVLAGRCDLFHLDDPVHLDDPDCGATLELIEEWDGVHVTYRLEQLRGRRNRRPPDAMSARADRLCADMAATARGLPQEQREAVRERRREQARRARRALRHDPTPAARRALWNDVYARRAPAAWRQFAPDKSFPWSEWSRRYFGSGLDACVAMDPVRQTTLLSLIPGDEQLL